MAAMPTLTFVWWMALVTLWTTVITAGVLEYRFHRFVIETDQRHHGD